MTKPVITTRAGKGSALTWTEGDTNLTNLRDATVSIKAGSAGTSVVSDLNGEITLVAGTNITLTGDNTAKTVTIDAAGGSATPAGSNQQIQFNNSGSFGASSSLYYDGVSLKVTSGNIESLYSNGDEGGEFRLATATTNTTLAGGSVAIDIYQNRLRIFETGGSTRGVYLDISGVATGVGSALAVQGTAASFSSLTNTGITTTIGTSAATLTTGGSGALTLNTNNGTSSGSILINAGTNGNITVTPNGTGKTITYGLNYRESVFTLGTTTVTSYYFTPTSGNIQTITVNASSFTLNTSAISAGDSITILLTGGTTAPAAITQSASGNWKWAGGSKGLSGVTGTTDVVSIFYDGSTHYVSINKGFV